MENINMALTLMAIGMGTVFLVLLLMILFSQGLIKIINKFAPAEESPKAKSGISSDTVPSKIVAVITAAVTKATGGKAKVVKIEKVK